MTSLKMAEVEVVVGGGKSGFQPTTISRRDQEILSQVMPLISGSKLSAKMWKILSLEFIFLPAWLSYLKIAGWHADFFIYQIKCIRLMEMYIGFFFLIRSAWFVMLQWPTHQSEQKMTAVLAPETDSCRVSTAFLSLTPPSFINDFYLHVPLSSLPICSCLSVWQFRLFVFVVLASNSLFCCLGQKLLSSHFTVFLILYLKASTMILFSSECYMLLLSRDPHYDTPTLTNPSAMLRENYFRHLFLCVLSCLPDVSAYRC